MNLSDAGRDVLKTLYESARQPQSPSELPIPTKLNEVHGAMEELERQVALLTERLRYVCLIQPQNTPQNTQRVPDEQRAGGSQLWEILSNLHIRIRNNVACIEDLIATLDV